MWVKRSVSAVLLTALATMFMLVTAGSAAAISSSESKFVSLVNSERSSRGKGSLTVKSDLVAVARRHSERMAKEGRIWHNPKLGSEVDGWTIVGENVGMGPSVESLHKAFMNSTGHRENILYSSYNQVGVGVVTDGDMMFVTQVFAQRGSASKTKTVSSSTGSSGGSKTVAAKAAPVAPVQAPKPKPKPVKAAPRTVDVLLRVVGYDAETVDPATGLAAGR